MVCEVLCIKACQQLKQRDIVIPVVAAKLLQETGVSEVLVGDSLIEIRQAKQLIDFCKHRHFTLCIEEVFDTTVTYLFDIVS